MGYVEAITAADIAGGRERERASEVAMRKDDLLDGVSATLWPRSLKRGSLRHFSRNVPSTTPPWQRATLNTRDNDTRSEVHRGLSATVDKANFVIEAHLNMYKRHRRVAADCTCPNINTKIGHISVSCISPSATPSFVIRGRVGGSVVLDVRNESGAFETSGTTDRTQRRIP